MSPKPAVEQRCGSTCWSAQQLNRHDCPLCWDQSLWAASVTVCQFLCGVKPAGGCSCPGWTSTNQIAISRSRTAASLCCFYQPGISAGRAHCGRASPLESQRVRSWYLWFGMPRWKAHTFFIKLSAQPQSHFVNLLSPAEPKKPWDMSDNMNNNIGKKQLNNNKNHYWTVLLEFCSTQHSNNSIF